MKTWISPDNRYTVCLTVQCLRRLVALSSSAFPNETGSQLFGYYSDSGFSATITDVSPVSRDSVSMRNSFNRGVSKSPIFDSRMRFCRRHYVGEWHTHPKNTPEPSAVDLETQRVISIDPDTNCPEVILVVVGWQSPIWRVSVTVSSRERGVIRLAYRDTDWGAPHSALTIGDLESDNLS